MKAFQPSMSAGELAPGLHGRVDTARYAIGLKNCRNCVTLPTGGVRKRNGYLYRGAVKTGTLKTVMLPFVYSTTARYIIEAGHLYLRFWYIDANNRLVQLESAPGVPYEIASPYSTADIGRLRITQSADVLYIAHPLFQPRELRRLTTSTFELREYENRLGPFRPMNAKDGALLYASGVSGNITLGADFDAFTESMVGSLVMLEEKELRSIAPWEPACKGVTVGTQKRSDGKVYVATAIAPGGTFNVTGGVRPVHEFGRAWDGGKDIRSDGVNNYSVGVEWEYLHGGYGIVKITEFTNARSVKALVLSRLPDNIIGTAPTPAGNMTLAGTGATTYAIFDAQSSSMTDYLVTIDGLPATQNPYQPPTTGGGGGGGGGGAGDPREEYAYQDIR